MAAPAPRKPRAPRAITTAPPVDDELLLDLIDLDEQSDEERGEFEATAPLFRINGKVYSARTKFSAGESIQYVKIARDSGMDDAMAYAMVQAVGEEGWQVFQEYPYMSAEHASRIIGQVTERINPPVADPKSVKR